MCFVVNCQFSCIELAQVVFDQFKVNGYCRLMQYHTWLILAATESKKVALSVPDDKFGYLRENNLYQTSKICNIFLWLAL